MQCFLDIEVLFTKIMDFKVQGVPLWHCLLIRIPKNKPSAPWCCCLFRVRVKCRDSLIFYLGFVDLKSCIHCRIAFSFSQHSFGDSCRGKGMKGRFTWVTLLGADLEWVQRVQTPPCSLQFIKITFSFYNTKLVPSNIVLMSLPHLLWW